MTDASLNAQLAPHRHKEHPLGLFIAYLRENADAGETAHKRGFKALLKEEGYDDFVDAIIEQWMSLNYNNALQATKPPSLREVKEAATRRAQERKREAADLEISKEAAKKLIGSRLLGLVCPNGKQLRHCTGADCVKFGGFYARIGKKVGPLQLVGKVLSEEGISALLK